jgi:hypothetical protein
VPAYILATYTGLSRVRAERHYLDDVIAGMSIALISGWTFVHPISDRIRLNPTLRNGGLGVTVTATPSSDKARSGSPPNRRTHRWRFTWEVGRITVWDNTVQAAAGRGDELDFRFRQRNNPMVTSNLRIDRRLNRRHHLIARLAPFEVREEEHYPQEVTFGGVTFPPEVLDTGVVGYDLRLGWRYRPWPESLVRFQVGAGLELVATRAELQVQNPPPGAPPTTGRGSDMHLLPTVHALVGLAPGRFLIYAEADGSNLNSRSYRSSAVGLAAEVTRSWRLGLAHRWVNWSLQSSRIRNRFSSETTLLLVTYSW